MLQTPGLFSLPPDISIHIMPAGVTWSVFHSTAQGPEDTMRRTTGLMLVALSLALALPAVAQDTKGQDTPRATVRKLVDALKAGDRTKFIECFDATEERKPLLQAAADMIFEMKALDDVCTKTFGDEWNASGGGFGRNPFKDLDADGADIAVDADKATVKFKTGPGEMQMVRKGGVWKITTDDMPTGEELKRAARMMAGMGGVLKEVRLEVEAGKLKTADEVRKAISRRMMAMMQKDTEENGEPDEE